MLMAHNFGMTIYIVDELHLRKNISHDCLIFRCRCVVVQDKVPISFWRGVGKCIHKPLAVTKIYLVRHGTELRRVSTVTKHHTVVRDYWEGPLALTLIKYVLHQEYYI